MASPAKLSVHSKAFVPSHERGFFDDLVHTFVDEERQEATVVPDAFTDVSVLPLSDVSPVAVLSNVNYESTAVQSCSADLRHLSVDKYPAHFTALLEAESHEARQLAVDADIVDHRFAPADCRLEAETSSKKAGGLLMTLRLPHLQEGIPHLEIGTVVRLRPQPVPSAADVWGKKKQLLPFMGRLGAKCEFEVLVEQVAPTRGVVVVRFPPRCVSRVCMMCLEVAQNAQQAARAGGWTPLPFAVHLATHWLAPCMHQVLCETHATATRDATGKSNCPFCLSQGVSQEVGACPSMPPHLQWTRQEILAGRKGKLKCGSVSLPAYVDIRVRAAAVRSWQSIITDGSGAPPFQWRIRFEETAVKPMLEATHRLRANCSWSIHGTIVSRLAYLQATLGVHCMELARCLTFMASRDVTVMSPASDDLTRQHQLATATVNLSMLLARATETGTDASILNGAFTAYTNLPAGTPQAFQYVRATSLLSAMYATIDLEQRLFPSLPGLFSFPAEQALIEANAPGRCPVDLLIVACTMLHVHQGANLQPLRMDDLIRMSSPTQLTGLAENLLHKIINGLSVRQRVMLDAVMRNVVLATLMQVSPEEGLLLLPQGAEMANDISMKSWQLLAQPVVHFFDERLNEQQQAAVQAVVSGGHGRAPFLLVGPAGCGKTSVDVEILMQLMTRAAMGYPSRGPHNPAFGRILLVAPSDEAVDLVLQRFIGMHGSRLGGDNGVSLLTGATVPLQIPAVAAVQPGGTAWRKVESRELTAAEKALRAEAEVRGMPLVLDGEGLNIVRLNARSRPFDTFAGKNDLYPYALVQTEEGVQRFVMPDVRLLARSVLVACTARVAAQLPSLGLSKGSFSHIVYDEASQSMEPEALSALLLAGPFTHVVLSGDPRQLGPNVRSAVAHEYGLSVSVQERIGLGKKIDGDDGVFSAVTSGTSAGVAHVTTHMADNLFRGRQASVYTSYQHDVLSGTWLGRRGVRRWPADRGPTAADPSATGNTLQSSSGVLQPLNYLLEVALTVNYRSHQALCDLPSRLFYQDAPIMSNASPERTRSALGFSLLAHKAGSAFPLLAIGVDGVESEPGSETAGLTEAEGQGKSLVQIDSGQSYINEAECHAAAWIIQSLLSESTDSTVPPPEPRMLHHSKTGTVQEYPGTSAAPTVPFKVAQKDIAVICPFRRQVLQMRDVLRKAGFSDVNVGQPQNLQGADKPVVIVCTVLAKRFGRELLEFYKRKQRGSPLGLLLNDKSFCVSITRPESLLIAIGHPDTWAAEWRREGSKYTPGNWAVLLDTAVEAGAFIGFGPRVSDTQQWSALSIPGPVGRRGTTAGGVQTAAGSQLFPRHVRPDSQPPTEHDASALSENMIPGGLL